MQSIKAKKIPKVFEQVCALWPSPPSHSAAVCGSY